MSQPRIPPRSPDDWDDAVFDALSVLRPPGAPAPAPDQERPRPASNILGIFSWHPALTKGWLQFNNHLFKSTLSARHREMVTVRISWLRKGEYEWAQHVRMAQEVGMTRAEVDAIIDGPDAAIWNPVDATVLRAVDELCADRYISDDTWTKLAAEFDRQQIMDIVFTAGAYELLCMAFNTFGLQLDPGLESFPS